MSKNTGITSILNKHYNDNHENFTPDIESQNLKTVLLKIGERPEKSEPVILEKIKPRRKRKILRNIHKGKTDTEIETILNQEKQKLIDLDDYFENYGKCRRLVLKKIYDSWCEDGEYCKSSEDILIIINENSDKRLADSTYNEIKKLEKLENKNKLSDEQTQELTNTFHQWVRSFIKEKELSKQIKQFGMDRLLPNLYEDISGGLVGFFRKLIQAECQYEKEIINMKNFIIELNSYDQLVIYNPYKKWNYTDFYGKIINGYLFQSCSSLESAAKKNGLLFERSEFDIKGNAKVNIYLEFREAVKNAEKLSLKVNIKDLLNFNNVYNQIRTACEIIKHHVKPQKDFELMFKKKGQKVKLIKTIEKAKQIVEIQVDNDGHFSKITPIYLNPKKTFPQFEDQNTLKSLYSKINNLHNKINGHKSNENLSIIEISKKKIFKEPFAIIRNKKVDKYGKMIPQIGIAQDIIDNEVNTPNGYAHKVFNDYFKKAKDGIIELDNKNKKIYDKNGKPKIIKLNAIECYLNASKNVVSKAMAEQALIYDIIENGKISQNYTYLRTLAGWIWVEMRILVEEITDYSKREGLIKEISELASTISGFAYNLERSGYENQSIYLSDFLTPPQDKSNKYNFKSSAYLTTEMKENKRKLSLAVSFKNAIFKNEDSTNKALVYTFDEANHKLTKEFNTENKELKYFDYEYWNKIAPLAYKSFTKPNIEIGVDKSEFTSDLHFGKNQSRKYFWNKTRGTGKTNEKPDNLVHDIFNPNSRLKVSSMRLIRKFNPIKTTWEYYLSLAIYRLEEAKIEIDTEKSKSIVGVDFGENQLAAFTHSDLKGKYLSSRNFDEKLTTHTLDLHKQIEKQIQENNHAKPKIRKKLGNKLKSAVQQASSQILRLNLDNNIVVFEVDATGNRKHITTGKNSFKKTTLMKDFRLLERSKLKNQAEIQPTQILGSVPKTQNAKININDLLGLVPTQRTSSLCSNCGFAHANDDKGSFIENLITKVDLERLKIDILNDVITSKIDIRDYINEYKGNESNEYDGLFIINLKTKIAKIENKITEITFAQEIVSYKKNYEIDNKAVLPESIMSLFAYRPKWFEGNVETFRCINCGHVEWRSCDKQASLNIARWRVFLQNLNLPIEDKREIEKLTNDIQDLNTNGINSKPIQSKGELAISKIPDINKEIEKQITKKQKEIDSKSSSFYNSDARIPEFISWYQTQLLKHGYDDNGNAKWNQPQKVQPLN